MAYFAPYVDASGLHICGYPDIIQDNVADFKQIYGSSQYCNPDSAIYQLLSIVSLKQYDTFQAIQLAYNQSSPLTAVGAGMDRVVKINGLARLPYTFSTAPVVITGTVGTVIANGFVQDTSGNQWALPTTVTISTGGSITVTVTYTTPGAIVAEPGTITTIATPIGGWTGATNPSVSIPGSPVETDSQLRARQAISVALPSSTRLAGTIADVLAVPGVVNLATFENPTGTVSDGVTIYGYPAGTPLPAGLPAHSITVVVLGGTDLAIATAIYDNRGIGCYTNGTTSQVVVDPNTGYSMTMRFYRPTPVPIYVNIPVHPLPGFTSATLAAIQAGVVNYLNSLKIGESVVYSELIGACLNARPDPDSPLFSIRNLTCTKNLATTFLGPIFSGTLGSSGGTGNAKGDVLTVVFSGGSGGKFTIIDVDGGGSATAVELTAQGTAYNVGTDLTTTSSGLGNGAKIDVTAIVPAAAVDIAILFNQVAEGADANVVVVAI